MAEQVGALCWRLHKGRVQVLLVTSRDTGRWVLPKGWPMAGKTAEAAKAADAIKAVAYPASLAELKGDLAMLSGKSDAAADFYRLALQQLSADAGSRGLIEMKLTDAGGSADKPKEIR